MSIESLQADIASLKSQIAEINNRIIAATTDQERNPLYSERRVLLTRLNDAEAELATLRRPPSTEMNYSGKDPQTGLSLYTDPATGQTFTLPDVPTDAQLQAYQAANPPAETTPPAPVPPPASAEPPPPAPPAPSEPPLEPGKSGNTGAGAPATPATGSGTTASDVTTGTTSTNGPAPVTNMRGPNILHNYVNYTYLYTLHLLTKEAYNQFATSEEKTMPESVVLIASAGRFNGTQRNPLWSEDFFIEDFEMETVIGSGEGGRGTNAVIMHFKIVEPNGFTFFERLIRTSKQINFKNHHELIYVIQLEFVGYDDEGNPTKIPNTTKYIPIVFTNVQMEVTPSGSEYKVTAIPHNHMAFRVMKVSTPINISVTAATVAEYFATTRDIEDSEDAADAARLENARSAAAADPNSDARDRRFAGLSTPKYKETKSLVTAINRYERQKVKEGTQEHADEFYVVFSPEIGESALVYNDKKTQITNTPINNPANYDVRDIRLQQAIENGNMDVRDIRLQQAVRSYNEVKNTNADLDNIFLFTARTGSRYNFTKLDSTLQERMIAMATEYKRIYGEKIRIESGFRTFEDQVRIKNNPKEAGANHMIGEPGSSPHERGAAVDIKISQAIEAERSGLLAKFGLQRPYGSRDPMHITVGPRTSSVSSAPNSSPPPIDVVVNDATRQEINYKVVKHEINAGTNIIDEINRVVRNSSFLLSQLKDPSVLNNRTPEQIAQEVELLKTTELLWWRIIPRVELKEYDHKRRTYAKKITYFVRPYVINSSLVPLTPCAPPTMSVKEYNYMFTGKNVDILDFKIDLNALYFIPITANAYKLNSTSRSPDTATVKSQSIPNSQAAVGIELPPIHAGSGAESLIANEGSERTGKVAIAADLQEHLLNSRGGHMLLLNLTILGDPDFIKQDDIYSGEQIIDRNLNGSIPMDEREVYVRVNFKTPVDYNVDTGLADKTEQSTFSGLFKLLRLTNTFSAGQFKQQLLLVRVFTDAKTEDTTSATSTDVVVK